MQYLLMWKMAKKLQIIWFTYIKMNQLRLDAIWPKGFSLSRWNYFLQNCYKNNHSHLRWFTRKSHKTIKQVNFKITRIINFNPKFPLSFMMLIFLSHFDEGYHKTMKNNFQQKFHILMWQDKTPTTWELVSKSGIWKMKRS